MKNCVISLIRGNNETSGRQNCYLFSRNSLFYFFVTGTSHQIPKCSRTSDSSVAGLWRHSFGDVIHMMTSFIYQNLSFFVICLSPEFLPVSGPLTRWCASTLGVALLCSSRAGSWFGAYIQIGLRALSIGFLFHAWVDKSHHILLYA